MSLAKWEEAWGAAFPVEMHTVQLAPVDIQRVNDADGIVRYLLWSLISCLKIAT
jgi:hypothetical protein